MTKQSLHSLIALLFIISGATGLLYQVVWFKYLSLFLGNATYAQTVVLASFMGGLAIGASLWGRISDRIRNPLGLYGVLEIGISVYCFIFPPFLGLVKSFFFQTVAHSSLAPDSTTVLAMKLVVSLITLLPPTILMGGTLPVLVKTVAEKIEESGKTVAILYLLNSFGAVIGTILCGFFMIRILGLLMTIYFGVVINLLIGIVALFAATRLSSLGHEKSEPGTNVGAIFTRGQIAIAITVAGISGAAAMIYEVAWVRLLIPVFGSSTYSFSLMLVAFITGITIGSMLVSKYLGKVRNVLSFLGYCQIGVVLSLVVTLPFYGRIPYIFWHLASILSRTTTAYPIFLVIEMTFCFLIMIVPTIFLGMTLPVASHIASRSLEKLGSSVGTVFSVNTLGTVIGSLATGLILIPWIGVRHTIEVGIFLNFLGAMLSILVNSAVKIRVKAVRLGITTGAIAVYFFVIADWSQLLMLSGVFRHISERTPPPGSYAEFVQRVMSKKDLYYKEGTTATVAVVEATAYGKKQNILIINGKADASSVGDMPTQVLLGQLPMLLHERADTALVIGLGAGVTVASILTHPVKRVDCVEISPEVVEASRYFEDVNHRALQDPRVSLAVDDALSYLHLTPRRYDVIVSEPSNPWIAGIGNLYTSEFFQLCRSKMRPGALMLQWFHLYEINDEILRMVLRTFQSVFPYVTVWQSMQYDVLILGSESPINPDISSIRSKMNIASVGNNLQQISIPDPATLLSLQTLSAVAATEYADYGVMNSEDKPYLEYWAQLAFFINTGVPLYTHSDERVQMDNGNLLLQHEREKNQITKYELTNIATLHSIPERGNPTLANAILERLVEKNPRDVPSLLKLVELANQTGQRDRCLSYLKRLMQLLPDNHEIIGEYAWMLYQTERPKYTYVTNISFLNSEQYLKRAIALSGDIVDRYRIHLGDIFYDEQRYGEAIQEYLRAAEIRMFYSIDSRFGYDYLFMQIARCFEKTDNLPAALQYSAQASLWNPGSTIIRDYEYAIIMKQTKASHK